VKTKKVVVIGGGTGTSIVLSGLKKYTCGSDCNSFCLDLTAVVPVTDDGGSTGRLRDEFGFLPVGDARQCLAALSAKEDELFRQLLLYRFSKGQGLKGHNLGNLILTALVDLLDSEPQALQAASKIFRLKGRVLPVSLDLVKLVAEYKSGRKIVSEHKIEETQLKKGDQIIKMFTLPKAKINPRVQKAIETADLITLGPGDLFNSVIANLVIKGMPAVLRKTRAQLVYIVNLMTLNSQTREMTASDHVEQVEKYLGRKIDRIIINNQPISKDILKSYQKLHEYPVKDDLAKDKRVIREKLLASSPFVKPKGDVLKRSLLRHSPEKLADILISLLK
jgi:uncharacterized cofD-like protein